ncbi:tRNA (adenosine(37)-N6)-threonylcarbamoyltransferase complex dimerization subunit type 1 TsaB [Porphyrobacter sp. TH134]|uniref:tRNA (adenosine(37)-N6)-threonylcarbamoyltransferase complex dimerization subunit type 1 TsaB n=1 Tax=Porphyrobacter sp. TH134 TaxID=2067450 RepID=UPI000C7A4D8C|nr:tRNA (adenosine(37)-N6)-threonylcarbamoyltransferase complex dimerization subunit type 1 TsaB [Porphyrobacter sp. TH134]PLK22274.1 tRNA (adenosine(37)-N6)-threonylcarbamoyltransferase complex dimerization subunit type 1 TsaB [Porphyrobacter sp. TH134]
MRTLAIETASDACSIALFEGEARLAHTHQVIGRGHAEALVPLIGAMPDKGRADRILVSLGPGSFTGVRIGLAAARALGFAWDAAVLGYPTLALIAAQAQAVHRGVPVTVCTNGGHGEWFVQDFGADGEALGMPASLTPDAARARRRQTVIAGNRAGAFAALDPAQPAEVIDIAPDAAAVPLLSPASLTPNLAPIYGRGPDATPMADRVRA